MAKFHPAREQQRPCFRWLILTSLCPVPPTTPQAGLEISKATVVVISCEREEGGCWGWSWSQGPGHRSADEDVCHPAPKPHSRGLSHPQRSQEEQRSSGSGGEESFLSPGFVLGEAVPTLMQSPERVWLSPTRLSPSPEPGELRLTDLGLFPG